MKSKKDYQKELENEIAMIALDDNSEGDQKEARNHIKYLNRKIKETSK